VNSDICMSGGTKGLCCLLEVDIELELPEPLNIILVWGKSPLVRVFPHLKGPGCLV